MKNEQYDIQEDMVFAHVVNRHGKVMTAHQMVSLVTAQYPAMTRTSDAARQHVNYMRRLLAGKCSRYPAKYTTSVIAQ
ncbi:hypothetical protein J41TS12_37270 [Paenibacillus antibioticophila]|uniref:Uncharacterized protein n=1 Tax=Paenibacillus antibioticophila TaxID=1274374 RepID=A0A919XUW2_9BACL|nr:hypothetical protein [Paenibacillus antibioticophila]GIO38866.1 hypothetical protein J41TS12_37270 [Paenibacillus antibioticophila]